MKRALTVRYCILEDFNENLMAMTVENIGEVCTDSPEKSDIKKNM